MDWNAVETYFMGLAQCPQQAPYAREMARLAADLSQRYDATFTQLQVQCLALILTLEGLRGRLVVENTKPNRYRVGVWHEQVLTTQWEVERQDMPSSLMCYLLTLIPKPL